MKRTYSQIDMDERRKIARSPLVVITSRREIRAVSLDAYTKIAAPEAIYLLLSDYDVRYETR
ncbi:MULTISPECIES: hypothetical protein [Rhizobium]|uniref:hypothetical protein n=1 Tax=Rhizobium TaxID=379 RepID=UPI0011068546|nr:MULTISPECIES: hypothetical protein [Rhizobium]NYT32626.1 hypothetical protein [Rhizobium sp. WYCCWR 11128]QKK32746.1 hypothetical protein FE844_024210 [Rhizobium indicum]